MAGNTAANCLQKIKNDLEEYQSFISARHTSSLFHRPLSSPSAGQSVSSTESSSATGRPLCTSAFASHQPFSSSSLSFHQPQPVSVSCTTTSSNPRSSSNLNKLCQPSFRQNAKPNSNVSNLFKPYSKYRATPRKKPSKTVDNVDFTISQVILLPRKDITKAVRKQKDLSYYFKNKLIAENVPLLTTHSVKEVTRELKESFKGIVSERTYQLLENTDVEILKDEGGELYPPSLTGGTPLHGLLLKTLFAQRKKKVYLRPSVNLFLSLAVDSDEDSLDDLDDNVPANESIEDNSFLDSDVMMDHHYFEATNSNFVDLTQEMNCELEKNETSEEKDNQVEKDPISDKVFQPVAESCRVPPMDNSSPMNDLTLEELMQLLKAPITNLTQRSLKIARGCVFESAVIGMNPRKFDVKKRLEIEFTDESGSKEDAVDDGGPRNEFFTLVFKDIRKSTLFEGSEDARFLALDSVSKDENKYFYCGQIFALALAYRGPGANFLSEEFYDCLLKKSLKGRELQITKIFDPDLRLQLEELQNIKDVNSLQAFMINSVLLTTAAGLSNTVVKDFSQKGVLLKSILKALLIDRLEQAFNQFLDGFNCLDCLDIIPCSKDKFKKFFLVHQDSLTSSDIRKAFKVKRSEERSAEYELESIVHRDWLYYLEDVEDNGDKFENPVTLEDVLIFATACPREPPFGWTDKPKLYFLHVEKMEERCKDTLPTARTCEPSLHLPVYYGSYENFCAKMNYAIKHCKTLSKV